MLHYLGPVLIGSAAACIKDSLLFGKRRHHSCFDRASVLSTNINILPPFTVLLDHEIWLPRGKLNGLKVLDARFFTTDGQVASFVTDARLLPRFLASDVTDGHLAVLLLNENGSWW